MSEIPWMKLSAYMRELEGWDEALNQAVSLQVFGVCPHPRADVLLFSKAKRLPKGARMCSRCGADPDGHWTPSFSMTGSAFKYLVPAMAERGLHLELVGGSDIWTARFGNALGTGTTPGLAICRAALAATLPEPPGAPTPEGQP